MEIKFTDDDFGRMVNTMGKYIDDLKQQDLRFECMVCKSHCHCEPDQELKYVYWIEHDWLHVVFAREFIESRGYHCEIFFDVANHRSDISNEEYRKAGIQAPWIMLYAIFTDYPSPWFDRFLDID
jgi:hypothetical protein